MSRKRKGGVYVNGKKKWYITIGIILIALTTGVITTLSLLQMNTNVKLNSFSYSDGTLFDAMLTEPEWDGIVAYETTSTGDVKNIYGWNGETPIYDKPENSTFGEDLAVDLIPNASAAKNPIITNLSQKTDVWVAAKITLVYGEQSPNKGKKMTLADAMIVWDLIEIDFNADQVDGNWIRDEVQSSTDISQVFYYQSQLALRKNNAAANVFGGTTTPLFTKIKMRPEAMKEDLEKLKELGGFAIYVEGTVVQSSVADSASKWTAWARENIVFDQTPL